LGRQLAVNDNYIVYTVRQSLVRAINQETGLNVLLKAHQQPICDMQLSPADPSQLVTLDVAGHLYCWRFQQGEDDEKPPTFEELGHILVDTSGAEASLFRGQILLHTTDANILGVVVAHLKAISLWDLSKVSKSEEKGQATSPTIKLECPGTGQRGRAAFSPDGSELAARKCGGITF